MNIYSKLILPSIISLVIIGLGLEFYWKPFQLKKAKSEYVQSVNNLITASIPGVMTSLLERDIATLNSNMDYLSGIFSDDWKNLRVFNTKRERIYPIFDYEVEKPELINNTDFIPVSYVIDLEGTHLGRLELEANWGKEKEIIINELNQARSVIVLLIFISILFGFYTTNSLIISPLKQLTKASSKISDGDFEVKINIKNKDEIGNLATSIKKMLVELKFQKKALDSHAIVSMTNIDGEIIYVNDKFCNVSKYLRNEIIGHTHALVKSESTSLEFFSDMWSSILDGKEWHGEICNKNKFGDLYWINSTIVPFIDSNGFPSRFLAISTDITEQKLAEKNLIISKEIAEYANRAKSDFLSSMSHELRTPLNSILGFSQILQFNESLDEDGHDCVNEIYNAGDHLLTFINDILDLSKIEAGKMEFSFEDIDPYELINACVSLIKPLASKNKISVEYSIDTDFYVYADFTRLKQSLANLLSNAIKYNRKNGSVFLAVNSFDEDKKIKFSIRDTGYGIAHDKLDKLFDPFNRLGIEGSNIEGSGIGLTITKNIVESMNGYIGVESEIDIGSVFWIDLPAVKNITSKSLEDNSSNANLIRGNNKTVLYIEDNPSNIKVVSKFLASNKSLTLITAHTPELGLKALDKQCPDLILLDINLPGMNGYQVLDIIKNNPKTTNIPVVAVTANAMEDDVKRGHESEFSDYMTKPLDFVAFNNTLSQFLND